MCELIRLTSYPLGYFSLPGAYEWFVVYEPYSSTRACYGRILLSRDRQSSVIDMGWRQP